MMVDEEAAPAFVPLWNEDVSAAAFNTLEAAAAAAVKMEAGTAGASVCVTSTLQHDCKLSTDT